MPAMMQSPRITTVLLLMLAIAAASLQAATAATFVCGAPGAFCGSALPKNANCTNGPGWCQSGYFCGWQNNTGEPSKCLPVPQGCGKTGKDCCPSNTFKPHTKPDDIFNLKPFCTDGSYCFYFAPQRGLPNGDYYAGVKGAYNCAPVPKDCGTGAGKPCCPALYRTVTNPVFSDPTMGQGCARGGNTMFCNYDVINPGNATADAALMKRPYPTGTCLANKPDCGQFGKSCCVFTSGAATGTKCGARWGESGPKGYCSGPNGQQMYVQNKEMVCSQCPANASQNPQKYFGC